jgi:hypothetical protein
VIINKCDRVAQSSTVLYCAEALQEGNFETRELLDELKNILLFIHDHLEKSETDARLNNIEQQLQSLNNIEEQSLQSSEFYQIFAWIHSY